MRRLFKNKSKFLAGICCLCLGVASLLAGAFSFVKAPAMAEEVADPWPGFYVEQGASIRYDDVVPGIRFAVYLTKAQWKELYTKGEYADDTEVVFKAEIHFANRLNQDGNTSNGYRVVDHTVTVKALNDYFEKAENVGKPFTVKPAILLSNAWKDAEGNETPKRPEELYKMYAEMEFYLTGAGIFVNEKAIAQKTEKEGLVKDYTLRSVRSVAASLLAKGAVTDENNKAVTEGFIKDAKGIKANIVPNDIKAYYDKYADSGKVDVSAVEGLQVTDATKVTIGSTKVGDRALDGTELTLSRSAATLTDGETYNVLVDNGDKIYALKGLTAATEIFYQANGVERLNARFAITKNPTDMEISVETVVKDGVEYSATFYGVDRGYYVLGEDIDFGGGWKSSRTASNSIIHGSIAIGSYSGIVGFGGTFDGNGYIIKNLKNNRLGSAMYASGLFGGLAYGAIVKDVAFVDAIPKLYNEPQNAGSVIASVTGSSATANKNGNDAQKAMYNYIVAKYGSTDCVTIDNCYFGLEDTLYGESGLTEPYSSSYALAWDGVKLDSGKVYTGGNYGLVYEGYEDFLSFKNSVFYLPGSERKTAVTNNGGVGWVSRTAYGATFYHKNGSILENCYQISETMYNGKIVPAFEFSTFGKINDEGKVVGAGTITATEFLENNDKYTYGGYLNSSWDIYAANDYVDIAEGTKVYNGFDADGNWVVELPTEENGYTENKKVYHYSSLYRYDNYVDMSINNKNDLSAFNSNWEVVDGALIWKGLADASAEKTLTIELSSEAIGVGDTIEVTAKYNGSDVTKNVTLSTDNASMLTINNVDKAFKVEKGGEATLYVKAGSYTAEYTIIASSVNQTAVTVSSNYSAVYGKEGSPYSVPYVANGKDLVATDFLTLYQNHFGDNDAKISAVYLLDETGAKTALDAVVDANDVSQYLFANAGNVKKALSIIVDGTEGFMSFADISSVTAVVADEYGFKYIPKTVTSRAGYYVLAKDFDDIKNTNDAWGRYNSRLMELCYNSNEVGYSFGGFDQEIFDSLTVADVPVKYSDNQVEVESLKSIKANQPFTGTFDGLGHTINNIQVSALGLLGRFDNLNQGSTLKNVQFTNLRAGIFYKTGRINQSTGENIAFGTYTNVFLGYFDYAGQKNDYINILESGKVVFDNVSIELADKGSSRSNYGYELSLADDTAIAEVKYAFFYYGTLGVQYSNYDTNKDGTINSSDKYYSYIHTGSSGLNMRTPKLKMNNVVIKFKTTTGAGYKSGSCPAGAFISHGNSSYGDMAYTYALWVFEKHFDNVYFVVPPTSNGKTAIVTADRHGGNKNIIGLPYNDFMEYFPDYSSGTYDNSLYGGKTTMYTSFSSPTSSSSPITTAWGNLTTDNGDGTSTKKFIIVKDYENFTPEEGSTFQFMYTDKATLWKTGFYATPIYRYDDYKDMSDSGVTRVGNFAITADGIVWSPAK